jgi:hypothetical protein
MKGITEDENIALIARKDDIRNYVNVEGGGLIGLMQVTWNSLWCSAFSTGKCGIFS